MGPAGDLGKYHVSCLSITYRHTQKSVRASIQDVTEVIKSAGIPKQITQQPFDGDPGHCRRLCNLVSTDPLAADLYDYALDMTYMKLQPELLRHLTPILLAAWRKDLFERNLAGYRGFVEQFWTALLNGKILHNIYSEGERHAFITYIRNSILDRMDGGNLLHFSGMGASPYRWIHTLAAYGIVFADVEILWTEWWQIKTPGHAIAAFQYASVLMYEEAKNPVFHAWTQDKGGGPPELWECGTMMFDVGWKKENLDFLKSILSADYLEQKLRLALDQIQDKAALKIASQIVDDFAGQRARLELRIEELPTLLMDVSQANRFTI